MGSEMCIRDRIYIAACAFLKETAERTATSSDQSRAHSRTGSQHGSRAASPPSETSSEASRTLDNATVASVAKTNQKSPSTKPMSEGSLERSLAKHSLLAKAASQHYQLCCSALRSLETYWAGTKYILTVLDQKFKGVGDPLLYTTEEGESSLEQPRPEPVFNSPGWRRRTSWAPSMSNQFTFRSPFLPPRKRTPGSTEAGHGQGKQWQWNSLESWTNILQRSAGL